MLDAQPPVYRTKMEMVYRSLREAIVSGEIAPGESLTTTQVAKALDVSEVPVREALVRLEAEGFVERRANATARVVKLNPGTVHQYNTIRSRLEGVATYLATRQGGQDLAERLAGILSEMRDALDEGDIAGYERLNRRFHDEIHQASGAPWLISALRDLRDLTERFRALFRLVPERAQRSFEEHAAICEAIRSGDAALAERLVIQHRMVASEALERAVMGPAPARRRHGPGAAGASGGATPGGPARQKGEDVRVE